MSTKTSTKNDRKTATSKKTGNHPQTLKTHDAGHKVLQNFLYYNFYY